MVLSCCDLVYHDHEETIVDLVNQHRETPVKWSDDLEIIATIHSEHMAETNYYDHIWEDGTDLRVRFSMVGITPRYATEIIHRSDYNSRDVINSWMDERCHREKLQDPNFNYIGMKGIDGYWTMVLMK